MRPMMFAVAACALAATATGEVVLRENPIPGAVLALTEG